ncbi:MAG: hypothetical protein PF692_03480 [Kiritimatiellae bacterium]|jgi:hypothetical protein|nr:hypothetical protein [Kiritimatiellia bacterium]
MTKSEHEKQEEAQWEKLFAVGNSDVSMLMMFVQKLCAVFHVFDPASDLGVLNESKWNELKPLLYARIFHVIDWAENVELSHLEGIGRLEHIASRLMKSEVSSLKDITEEIHQANHAINDQLEREYLK